MKIIKLSDTHYIGVDGDCEEGDVYYTPKDGVYMMECGICNSISKIKDAIRLTGKPFYKITHSTQPIEQKTNSYSNGFNMKSMSSDVELVFDKIKPLSLSEVEEAINGYSVEKMAHEYAKKEYPSELYTVDVGMPARGTAFRGFLEGFNTNKELVKDKVFTIKQVKDIIFQARTFKSDWLDEFYSLDEEAANPDYNPCFKYTEEEIIQSLLPKTEWECTIDEQGKIKLI